MSERFRIRSIPPRTTLDAHRRVIGGRTGGSRLHGDVKKQSRELSEEELLKRWAAGHVFQKPLISEPIYKIDEGIGLEAEVMDDYDGNGGLGIILRFSGIEFTNSPVFEKSWRDYGPDSKVFYSSVGYKKNRAFLVLATYGDILESQVVTAKMDVRPFFREEILLPQLETHDPSSMTVCEKNHLVIVGYNNKP